MIESPDNDMSSQDRQTQHEPAGDPAAPMLSWIDSDGHVVQRFLPNPPRLYTIGRGISRDVLIANQSVSRSHAVLTPIDDDWCVEDVGSTHGTIIERAGVRTGVTGRHTLRHGDRMILGDAVVVFRDPTLASLNSVEARPTDDYHVSEYGGRVPGYLVSAGDITPAEDRILSALCRPRDGRSWASNADIAKGLQIEVTTVRTHMKSLYRKFSVPPDWDKDQRRAELVVRAMTCGWPKRDRAIPSAPTHALPTLPS